MKSSIKIAALIASTFAFSTQAKEVSLEEYVTGLVSNVVVGVQEELSNNIQESLIELSLNAASEDDAQYATTITINDIQEDVNLQEEGKAEKAE